VHLSSVKHITQFPTVRYLKSREFSQIFGFILSEILFWTSPTCAEMVSQQNVVMGEKVRWVREGRKLRNLLTNGAGKIMK